MLTTTKNVSETLKKVQADFSASSYGRQTQSVIGPNALHTTEAEIINEFMPENGVLADIGTGYGIMPELFHTLGYRVISVDFPKTGGTEALRRLTDIGVEGVYAEVGREPIPIADGSVDLVFAGNVIEHLLHSPRQFLAEFHRILRPGGHVVIDTINAVDLRRRIKFLLGISNWPPIDYLFPLEFHHEHHKEYTLEELETVLRLSGFQKVRAFSFETFFTKPLKASPFRYLRKSARMMTPTENQSIFADRFQASNPAEYARLLALGLVKLFPSLRSDILVVGRKTPDVVMI